MKVKRRTVLKALAAFPVAGTTVLPSITKATEFEEEWKAFRDPFSLDDDVIKYCGPSDGSYTVLEFYKWLKSKAGKFNDEEDVFKITDEMVVLNDLELDDSSIRHLQGGTIIDDKGRVTDYITFTD